MNKKVLIAPSVLSADFSKMGEEILSVEKAGADLIHLDVMDGVFVNNITFGIKLVADIRPLTKLPLDTHLMIVNPEKYIEKFASAGSDIITVHFEACKEKTGEVLKLIKDCGKSAGLAVNPDTELSFIEKFLPLCDMVLIMSVFPGFGGQKYIESVTDKISEVKKISEKIGKNILVEVDGGINANNFKTPVSAGADILVAGSAVFNSADRKGVIKTLKE